MAGEFFDTGEVDHLYRDLGRVPGRVVPAVEAVVFKGATNIKKDWRNRWKGLGHLPRVAGSIDFDMKSGLGGIEAEIGANRSKPQGNLAHIAENGTVKNAPHPGGAPALVAETPKFLKALGDAAAKVVDL